MPSGSRTGSRPAASPPGTNVSRRYSAALTFNPTEFSRVRVQYNAGQFWNEEKIVFHQVFVQFQMSLGVHGAHRF